MLVHAVQVARDQRADRLAAEVIDTKRQCHARQRSAIG
jgi:hypothetical protein